MKDDPAIPPTTAAEAMWRVLRQGDNGNVFVIANGFDSDGARTMVEEYERRGHKQIYWTCPE